MVSCPNCQLDNLEGAPRCENCGMPLIKPLETYQQPTPASPVSQFKEQSVQRPLVTTQKGSLELLEEINKRLESNEKYLRLLEREIKSNYFTSVLLAGDLLILLTGLILIVAGSSQGLTVFIITVFFGGLISSFALRNIIKIGERVDKIILERGAL